MLTEFDLLMGKLRPELTKAFSCIPDYGSLGIIIHFQEKEPYELSTMAVFPENFQKYLNDNLPCKLPTYRPPFGGIFFVTPFVWREACIRIITGGGTGDAYGGRR